MHWVSNEVNHIHGNRAHFYWIRRLTYLDLYEKLGYIVWVKIWMELFVRAKEADCWQIKMDRDLVVTPSNPSNSKLDFEKKNSLSESISNYLVFGLTWNEFNRVFIRNVKEMYNQLVLIYDRTKQVKKFKINTLLIQIINRIIENYQCHWNPFTTLN